MKKRVFIDMDNVLVDFQSGLDMMSEETKQQYAGRLDEIPGLFGKMKPMAGAIEAVHRLQEHFDLFILSTAPWNNPSAWSDKVQWVDLIPRHRSIKRCNANAFLEMKEVYEQLHNGQIMSFNDNCEYAYHMDGQKDCPYYEQQSINYKL